jgi:uncharacterized protein YycO
MKKVLKAGILLLGLIAIIGCPLNKTINADYQNGDIIFQESSSSQSKAIQLATKSSYSHCGIIYQNNGKYYVYEAVQPVKLTPLKEWIDRGVDDKFVVKRLKNANEVLTPKVLMKMKNYGEKFLGKDYDIYFNWDDSQIYCSELVWKIYKNAANVEVGKLKKFKDFDLSSPVVKKVMKRRYGETFPWNEKVVSPQDIFECPKLIEIERN